jgi:hypothetical protein
MHDQEMASMRIDELQDSGVLLLWVTSEWVLATRGWSAWLVSYQSDFAALVTPPINTTNPNLSTNLTKLIPTTNRHQIGTNHYH